jgi:hypothetical protein
MLGAMQYFAQLWHVCFWDELRGGPPPGNAYITEDTLNNYITEDGLSNYVVE